MTQLFTEDQVAFHISKVLEQWHESGMPGPYSPQRIPRSISSGAVRKCILDKISTEAAMSIDHETIMESRRIAVGLKRVWKPWDLASAVMNLQEEQHREVIAKNRKAAQESDMAKSIGAARDAKEETDAFVEWLKALDPAEKMRIEDKWCQKLDIKKGMRRPPTGLLMKWEYKQCKTNP